MASIAGPSNTVDPSSTADPSGQTSNGVSNAGESSRRTEWHNDVCSKCGVDGFLYLCETCNGAYHFECSGLSEKPALDEDFCCPLCKAYAPAPTAQLAQMQSEEEKDIFPPHIVNRIKERLRLHFNTTELRTGKLQRWTSRFPTRGKNKRFVSLKQAAELFIALTNYRCEDWAPLASVRPSNEVSDEDWNKHLHKILTEFQINDFHAKRGRGKGRWFAIRNYFKKLYKTWITEAFEDATLEEYANDSEDDDSNDEPGDREIEENQAQLNAREASYSSDHEVDLFVAERNIAPDAGGMALRLEEITRNLLGSFDVFENKLMKQLSPAERKTLDLEIGKLFKNRFVAISNEISNHQLRQYARTILLGCNGQGKSTALNLLLLMCERARSSYGSKEEEMIEYLLRDVHSEMSLIDPGSSHSMLSIDDFIEKVTDGEDDTFKWEQFTDVNKGTKQEEDEIRRKEMEARDLIRKHSTQPLGLHPALQEYYYLFPVGNDGTSTTEIGKGVRFGPEFSLMIKFKRLEALQIDIDKHDFTNDKFENNDAERHHDYMKKLVQALRHGEIKEASLWSDDEDDDEGDEPVSESAELQNTLVPHKDIKAIDGRTVIFTAEGKDSILDQNYIRKKIEEYTCSNDPKMKAKRMFIDDMIVYAPSTLLEGKKSEIRDVPGAADNNSIKRHNLLTEIDLADHAIIVMARNLEHDKEMNDVLKNRLIPRYIDSRSLSAWKLLSHIPIDMPQYFQVEELLDRVQNGEDEDGTLTASAKALFSDPVLLRATKTKEEKLLDLFNDCLKTIKRGLCRRRLDIDFIIIPELKQTLDGMAMEKKINRTDDKAMQKVKESNDLNTRKYLKECFVSHGIKGKDFKKMLRRLTCQPRIVTLYPFLYASLLTSTEAGFDRDEEIQFDRQKVMEASGGRDLLRLFDSSEARHSRHCVNKLLMAFQRYGIDSHADYFFSSSEEYHPQVPQFAKLLRRDKRIRTDFNKDLKGMLGTLFDGIKHNATKCLESTVQDPNKAFADEERERLARTITETFQTEICSGCSDKPKEIVRVLGSSKTTKSFYLKIRDAVLDSTVFNFIQDNWIRCAKKLIGNSLGIFSKRLCLLVKDKIANGKKGSKTSRDQLSKIIEHCVDHYAKDDINAIFDTRQGIGYLNRKSVKTQYFWRVKLEKKIEKELCKACFVYNSKTMKDMDLLSIHALFGKQLKTYIAECEKAIVSSVKEAWNKAAKRTLGRIVKCGGSGISNKLYTKLIKSCSSDRRAREKMVSCLKGLNSNLKALEKDVNEISKELSVSKVALYAASETRIIRMRIVDYISNYKTVEKFDGVPQIPTLFSEWKRRCLTERGGGDPGHHLQQLHNFFKTNDGTLKDMEWENLLTPYHLTVVDHPENEGTLCEALLSTMGLYLKRRASILKSTSMNPDEKEERARRQSRLFEGIVLYTVHVIFCSKESEQVFKSAFDMTLQEFQEAFATWLKQEGDPPLPNALKTPLILGFASMFEINIDVWISSTDPKLWRVSPYTRQRNKLFKNKWSASLAWDEKERFRIIKRKRGVTIDGRASEISSNYGLVEGRNSRNEVTPQKVLFQPMAAASRKTVKTKTEKKKRKGGTRVFYNEELDKMVARSKKLPEPVEISRPFNRNWKVESCQDGTRKFLKYVSKRCAQFQANSRKYAQILQMGYYLNKECSTGEIISFSILPDEDLAKLEIDKTNLSTEIKVPLCVELPVCFDECPDGCKKCARLFSIFVFAKDNVLGYSRILDLGFSVNEQRTHGGELCLSYNKSNAEFPKTIVLANSHRCDLCLIPDCSNCKRIFQGILQKKTRPIGSGGSSSYSVSTPPSQRRLEATSGVSAPQCGNCAQTDHSLAKCPYGTPPPPPAGNRRKRRKTDRGFFVSS
jgi:hypothetical protein